MNLRSLIAEMLFDLAYSLDQSRIDDLIEDSGYVYDENVGKEMIRL